MLAFGMRIERIDTRFQRDEFCGVFLISHDDGAYSLVEAGSTLSVPPTLAFLEYRGISPLYIAAIFITHAHLDHMGGVGVLASACSSAAIYCHPYARPHVVDPLSKLVPAAIQVYGQEVFDKDYPGIRGVDADRVFALQDGETVRGVKCLHTPGHAFHHCCYVAGRTLFSGDGFGFAFKALGFCPLLCTSPSQFDAAAWKASAEAICRLIDSGDVTVVQPTHFDCFEGSETLKKVQRSVLRQLSEYEKIISVCDDRDYVKAHYIAVLASELREFGCSDVDLAYALIYGDINVDGLLYRVQRRLAKK